MLSSPVVFPWCLWPSLSPLCPTHLGPHTFPGNPDSSSQGWRRRCHSDSCWMSSRSSGLCSFSLKIMLKLEAANHRIPKHAPAKAPLSKDTPMESNSSLSLGNQAILQRETMSPGVRRELSWHCQERRGQHSNSCYFIGIWQLLKQNPLSRAQIKIAIVFSISLMWSGMTSFHARLHRRTWKPRFSLVLSVCIFALARLARLAYFKQSLNIWEK